MTVEAIKNAIQQFFEEERTSQRRYEGRSVADLEDQTAKHPVAPGPVLPAGPEVKRVIRGWLQYYGRYYRSALNPLMGQLNHSLARWAERKYKKLRGHMRRANQWIARLSRRDPHLFAHWAMASRVTRFQVGAG